jgi:hypothetical protein
MFVPQRKHITFPLRAWQINAIYRIWLRYINITVTILDIIHRPVFYLKHSVSEIGFWLRFQVEPSYFGPIDIARLSPKRCIFSIGRDSG